MAIDVLASIVERKRVEVARRRRHLHWRGERVELEVVDRALGAYAALARGTSSLPRVIAEIKHRSPSAGVIRSRVAGGVAGLARAYESGGAAAVSVLCDGPGFGGTPLDVRRAAGAVNVPLLFKEFVLDECQVALARECGASMVLLLVRVLEPMRLAELVDAVHRCGMAPVVEAADDRELAVALGTAARIIGVNARDLRNFHVDGAAAQGLVETIPPDRIAVYMSGVRSAGDLRALAAGRADAVLVGEGLMRANEPGLALASWLRSAST